MLNNIINRPPDGKAQNELAHYLRKLPEHESSALMEILLKHNSDVVRESSLRLIPRVIRDRSVLIKFLDMGLEKNVSGAKPWIKATVSGLGYKKLL